LEKGASEDANILLKNFLGRDPKLEPFLQNCGLAETPTNIVMPEPLIRQRTGENFTLFNANRSKIIVLETQPSSYGELSEEKASVPMPHH
jgi:hypothetical protein